MYFIILHYKEYIIFIPNLNTNGGFHLFVDEQLKVHLFKSYVHLDQYFYQNDVIKSILTPCYNNCIRFIINNRAKCGKINCSNNLPDCLDSLSHT